MADSNKTDVEKVPVAGMGVDRSDLFNLYKDLHGEPSFIVIDIGLSYEEMWAQKLFTEIGTYSAFKSPVQE